MTAFTKEIEEILKDEIESLQESSNDSRKRAHNSYGAGYDQGRLDGVLWTLLTLKGKQNDF